MASTDVAGPTSAVASVLFAVIGGITAVGRPIDLDIGASP
jgi:hypothetical protein